MITESVEISVASPPDRVFAFLTDAANHPRWDASSVVMEPVQAGPWRPGLEFREVRRIGPRRTEVRSRVAAMTAPTSMDIESLTGPRFTGRWRLEGAEGRTILRWTGTMELTGPMRVLRPFVARSFHRATERNFARLKAILDAEGGSST